MVSNFQPILKNNIVRCMSTQQQKKSVGGISIFQVQISIAKVTPSVSFKKNVFAA